MVKQQQNKEKRDKMRTIKDMNEAEVSARGIRAEIKDAIHREVYGSVSACCNQIGLATDMSNKLSREFAEEIAQQILNAADYQNKFNAVRTLEQAAEKRDTK
jgi:nitrate/TMAO reductase-like tetraheme cytochrome c subunit